MLLIFAAVACKDRLDDYITATKDSSVLLDEEIAEERSVESLP